MNTHMLCNTEAHWGRAHFQIVLLLTSKLYHFQIVLLPNCISNCIYHFQIVLHCMQGLEGGPAGSSGRASARNEGAGSWHETNRASGYNKT